MVPYHKIDTVFKRDPANNHKTLIEGDYAQESFAQRSKRHEQVPLINAGR